LKDTQIDDLTLKLSSFT